MTRYAILLSLPLLSACNIDAKNPAGSDDKVVINADDKGKVEFDLPFAKGEVKLPEGMMQNGDVDIDGVKLMPGSRVTGFSVNAGDKASDQLVSIGFSAPKSPAEVRSYFAGEFAKKGAQTTVTDDAVAAKMKDGDEVKITANPDGAGSTGMIAIHNKN